MDKYMSGDCLAYKSLYWYKADEVVELAKRALKGFDEYWVTLPGGKSVVAELKQIVKENDNLSDKMS